MTTVEAASSTAQKSTAPTSAPTVTGVQKTAKKMPAPAKKADGEKKAEEEEEEVKPTPYLKALVDEIYSEKFRKTLEEKLGCGKLADRVDMAAQAYTQGCHLITKTTYNLGKTSEQFFPMKLPKKIS